MTDQEPEVKKKRTRHVKPHSVATSKNQLRNLTQYRDLSDKEFEEAFAAKIFNAEKSKLFEQRIQAKLDDFAKDYDVDDLKMNDKLILRALAQAVISLEDYEHVMYTLRAEGVSSDNIYVIEKIQKVMTDLRTGISNFQDDLKITRKVRKGDTESSFLSLLETLKAKAKAFTEARLNYITCPKCKRMICSVWFLFPEGKNKITLTCGTTLEDGSKCGEVITISSKDLLERRGYSDPSIMPESLL